mgnify:CR=1 FL=1|tara:strand:+ start:3899 stop:4930 length:1032 start_codon:yes stop_codon:yes gene_type:complete
MFYIRHSRTVKLISKILFEDSISISAYKKYNLYKGINEKIVKIGSKELMLPAIYNNLKNKNLDKFTDPELIKYLKSISEINFNRNNLLLNDVYKINKILNQAQINHVFLKGSALLAGGYYPSINERMIGDIDILVENKKLNETIKKLKDIGYYKITEISQINDRHYPRLANKKSKFALEVHSKVLNKNYNNLLKTDKILKNKNFIENIPIPSNNDLLIHCILNYQINDGGNKLTNYNFKSMYDISRILKKNKLQISKYTKYRKIRNYMNIASIINKNISFNKLNLLDFIYRIRFSIKQYSTVIRYIENLILDLPKIIKIKIIQFREILTKGDYRKYLLKKYSK